MRDWYLWNNLLPGNVDVDSYATPEALLAFLMTFSPDDGSGQPIDHFSYIGSAEADAPFFGEGKVEKMAGNRSVDVFFPRHGRKTLHLDYAKLEVVD